MTSRPTHMLCLSIGICSTSRFDRQPSDSLKTDTSAWGLSYLTSGSSNRTASIILILLFVRSLSSRYHQVQLTVAQQKAEATTKVMVSEPQTRWPSWKYSTAAAISLPTSTRYSAMPKSTSGMSRRPQNRSTSFPSKSLMRCCRICWHSIVRFSVLHFVQWRHKSTGGLGHIKTWGH